MILSVVKLYKRTFPATLYFFFKAVKASLLDCIQVVPGSNTPLCPSPIIQMPDNDISNHENTSLSVCSTISLTTSTTIEVITSDQISALYRTGTSCSIVFVVCSVHCDVINSHFSSNNDKNIPEVSVRVYDIESS